MSNDNIEIKLGCYQGISDLQFRTSTFGGQKTMSWKENFAIQKVDLPRPRKGKKKEEYTCRFCGEKVELTVGSKQLQLTGCLGILLVIASAVGLIYLFNQIQILENYIVTLGCSTVGIGILASLAIAFSIMDEVQISETSQYEEGKNKHKIFN